MSDNIKKLTNQTKIIFISSPNNPTGTSVSNDDIKYLLDTVKGRAIVVVDEAYIEFSPLKTMIDMINDYPNLIILRNSSVPKPSSDESNTSSSMSKFVLVEFFIFAIVRQAIIKARSIRCFSPSLNE